MGFRTNKVPAIEERTVSGSSVSFNSAFALPLKACKVSFSATQASGTPSPSTPLPISGVSAIGLTANSTPVSVSLGDTRYGGELDVLTGELTVNRKLITVDGNNTFNVTASYIKSDACDGYVYYGDIYPDVSFSQQPDDLVCDKLKFTKSVGIWGTVGVPNQWQPNRQTIHFNIANDLLGVVDYTQETTTSVATKMKNWFANNPSTLTIPIEPITIQLSTNELSSIIGNNTFSTDTGTLEITFADLQEKSASGAVATFNTALAMPLASCNIAVNAWQEGSGDPSPSNVRPIHGFSEVNATRAGKNLYNDERSFANPSSIVSGNVKRLFTPNTYCLGMSSNNYMAGILPPPNISNVIVGNGSISFDVSSIQGGTAYLTLCCPVYNLKVGETYFVSGTRTLCDIYVTFYKKDGTYINYTNQPNRPFVVPANTDFAVIIFRAGNTGTVKVENIQLEVGSTATAYEPYVTPTIYTIQLGEEVYGAEVDAKNGVAHVDRKLLVLDGTETYRMGNSSYIKSDACDAFTSNSDIYPIVIYAYQPTLMCDKLSFSTSAIWNRTGYANKFTINNDQIHFNIANDLLGITDYTQETTATALEKIKTWITNNPLTLTIPIQPFDIQLTPTQIQTLIGNNTIFADTGDVDLTYKDLDIAKRGNFREVFKLPS